MTLTPGIINYMPQMKIVHGNSSVEFVGTLTTSWVTAVPVLAGLRLYFQEGLDCTLCGMYRVGQLHSQHL